MTNVNHFGIWSWRIDLDARHSAGPLSIFLPPLQKGSASKPRATYRMFIRWPSERNCLHKKRGLKLCRPAFLADDLK
jgi:hypothetical protein